jgi:hypothetical protein
MLEVRLLAQFNAEPSVARKAEIEALLHRFLQTVVPDADPSNSSVACGSGSWWILVQVLLPRALDWGKELLTGRPTVSRTPSPGTAVGPPISRQPLDVAEVVTVDAAKLQHLAESLGKGCEGAGLGQVACGVWKENEGKVAIYTIRAGQLPEFRLIYTDVKHDFNSLTRP